MNTTQKKAFLSRAMRTVKKLRAIETLIEEYVSLGKELDALLAAQTVTINVTKFKESVVIDCIPVTVISDFLFEQITRRILSLEEELREKGVSIQALISSDAALLVAQTQTVTTTQ